MSLTRKWTHSAWRPFAALALVLGLTGPAWGAIGVSAQEGLPAIAEAVPESAVLFHATDLDRDGAQWRQTETLLARVGLPDALDLWEEAILEDGERSGDITAAELDALLGGEMAVVVLPAAVERFATMAMMGLESDTLFRDADATPVAGAAQEPHGIVAILRPGDLDAAWDYVGRQFSDLAGEQNVSVAESAYGAAEVLALPPGAASERSGMDHDGSMEGMDDWMGGHGMDDGGIVAARAGDYIVAGKSEADVTGVINVIDGAAGSLADSVQAQAVAAELPAEALSLTYIDGQGIVDGLDPEAIAMLRSLTYGMPIEAWESRIGLAISADEPGFRFDTITIYDDAANLGSLMVANDAAVASAAERAPAGTFAFQAGRLAENAYLGAPYLLAQAVNAAEAGESPAGDEDMMAFPTEEEMEEEIAAATATLGFDPRVDLFDLLGDEYIAFTSFPSFTFENFGVDAVAAVATNDPDALAETAQKIAAWVDRSDSGTDISARQVGEETVYVVSDDEMEGIPALEFGVVADQAVVAFGGGIEALVAEPVDALADDAQFQTVMALLPGSYYQIAYVDIGQAIDPIVNLIGVLGVMEGAGSPDATPVSESGGPHNIRALGAVAFQEGNMMGSSAILYIDG